MALTPPLINADPLEPRLRDPGRGFVENVTDPELLADNDADGVPGALVEEIEKPYGLTEAEVLALLADSKRIGRSYQQYFLEQWEWSELAYRSKHYGGSKYHRDQYKNRAKYFKPKTKESVLKNIAATRAALLASQDVISFTAEDDGNPAQRANAALLKEIINARLINKTMKSGVPWQMIALGGRLDCQRMGFCVAKTNWSYEADRRTEYDTVQEPRLMPNGQPVIDFSTGQPWMETREVPREVVDVKVDKPTVTLIPGENILLSPGADWTNPVQSSPTLCVPWPMQLDQLKRMMAPNGKSRVVWRDITDLNLNTAYYTEHELLGVKSAREGNKASVTTERRGATETKGVNSGVLDVWECFYRVDGIDYQCWMLGNNLLLSDPMPTAEAYPAHRGVRPYVVGTDVLETHSIYPESHVYSWRQAQEELNDFANLRMDANRKATFPVAKVVRGRQIDYRSVQRGDSQGVIQVKSPDDVTWDRPPGADASAYQEANQLANDLDTLAGNFSQNSVQANRSLNETVGGMQLIAANAGATSELFLAIYIDTFIEPILSHLVMLEQYYEDDETLLAVSGQKAKLFESYGIDEITNEMLETQINVRLDITIGGADPMMRLMKFKTVFDVAMPIISMAQQSGKIGEVKFEEMLGEVFSNGGYRNGAQRFFTFLPPDQPPPVPPEQIALMQQQLQELQAKNAELEGQSAIKMAQIQADAETTAAHERAETERLQMQFESQRALQDDEQQHETQKWSVENMAGLMMEQMRAQNRPQPTAARFGR